MKEIIYLDTELMNSLLAQIDEGLTQSFILESSSEEKDGESIQTGTGKKAGLQAGLKVSTGSLPGGEFSLGANTENSGNESNSYSKTILEGQRDILNKAFHDYALELLIEKLSERRLLVDNEKLEEGSMYIGDSTYRFYDFQLISNASNSRLMKNLIMAEYTQTGLSLDEAKRISKKSRSKLNDSEKLLRPTAEKMIQAEQETKPIVNVMDTLSELSDFSSTLLENLVIIKTGDKIGLLKKEMLRESSESLSFRTDKGRRVKYLVRIIGKKDIVYDGADNFPDFFEEDLDTIPSIMLDIILGSFNIIKKGDILVSPVAIYYE